MPIKRLKAKGTKIVRLEDPTEGLLEELRGLRGRVAYLETVEPPTAPSQELSEPIVGKDGVDGKDGEQGPRGLRGEKGADGTSIVWKRQWSEQTEYQPGDAVNYLGSSYIANAPSRGSYPNRVNNEWDLMAAAGSPGAQGPKGPSGDAASLLWNDYVMNYKTEPTLQETIAEGDVYLYTYDNGGTAYRLVPTDGMSEDAFYSSFVSSTLSGLIVSRGMEI